MDGHDQRWVGDDPQLAVDLACALCEDPHAVARPGLRHVLLGSLRLLLVEAVAGDLGADDRHDLLDVHVVVPRVERSHVRGRAHHFPVLADGGHDDRAPIGRGEAAVATEDLDARGQTLHVPLPRPGQRLVEVVDVEHQPPLG